MKTVQLKDFEKYTFLSSVAFAPGKEKAIFAVHNCTEDEQGYKSDLWLYEDEKIQQITFTGNNRSFLWEDEEHILFADVRSEEETERVQKGEWFTSWYRMNIYEKEAKPAFVVPFQCQSMKKLNEKEYMITGQIENQFPDYYKMTSEEREKVHQFRKEEEDFEVIDESPFWSDGGIFKRHKRTALFRFNVETGECKRLTEKEFQTGSFVVVGKNVYFAGKEYQAITDGKQAVFCYDSEAETVTCINDEKKYEIFDFQIVDDQLLCIATDREEYGESENPKVYCIDKVSGEISSFSAWKNGVGSSVISDCRYGSGSFMKVWKDALYFIATIRDRAQIWKLDKNGNADKVVEINGSVDSFDISESGVMILVGMQDMELQELYRIDLKEQEFKAVPITSFNEKSLEDTYVAVPEKMTVFSEGWDIDGWVLKPADFDPQKTYPAILNIHGGPKMAFGDVFVHEMQYWAGKGYFVMFCNPLGSDGRGDAFGDIRGKYGTIDYRNIMDFTDSVLEKYPQIDSKRMAVTGGSYGGFMTNWIVGHTDRFACAAAQRSISNFVSMYGISDIGRLFVDDQICPDIWNNLDKVWEHSPLKYAVNVKTPMLFVHSTADYRCHASQAMQMYTAIVQRGVPAKMVLIRGEGHSLSRIGKPVRRVRRIKEITDWVDKYTGEEKA